MHQPQGRDAVETLRARIEELLALDEETFWSRRGIASTPLELPILPSPAGTGR